jgi:hypothetical protein
MKKIRTAVITGLAGLALTGAAAATPAHAATTAPETASVSHAFTAQKHADRCYWKARGKHEFITYAYLRMVTDTCSVNELRIRISGKCSVAGWRNGNWIHRGKGPRGGGQLTSISCPAGQGYFTIVAEYQYWWPKSARLRHGHKRGRVHQIFLQ